MKWNKILQWSSSRKPQEKWEKKCMAETSSVPEPVTNSWKYLLYAYINKIYVATDRNFKDLKYQILLYHWSKYEHCNVGIKKQ